MEVSQKMKKSEPIRDWCVRKIAVIGPGIVGMPMAAMLAHSRIRIGTQDPAKIIVIQRNSPTSGWKVASINKGSSPIGGIEPGLNDIVNETVSEGLLSATHDYEKLRDADVIVVCVQTDKKGFAPDYDPLFASLEKDVPVSNLGFLHHLRVKLEKSENKVIAIPIKLKGSGVLSTLTESDGIIEIPPFQEGLKKGDNIPVKLFPK